MTITMSSSKILAYYKETNRPKFIQIVHYNGQVDLLHCLLNGKTIRTMIKKPIEKKSILDKIKNFI
jgi:hypothetical protein